MKGTGTREPEQRGGGRKGLAGRGTTPDASPADEDLLAAGRHHAAVEPLRSY